VKLKEGCFLGFWGFHGFMNFFKGSKSMGEIEGRLVFVFLEFL